MDVDLYARISDAADTDTFGVDNQVRSLTTYVEALGHTVVNVHVDNSVSASLGKERPEFERLLKSDAGRVVWAVEWERLIRDPADLERIIKAELKCAFIHAGPIDLSTDGGILNARILTAVAANEIRAKSRRAKLANASRAEDGYPHWKQAPYGHTRTGEIVPDQADRIRAAAQSLIDGHSLYSIAAQWAAEGVPTRHGGDWTPATLKAVLQAPRMVGTLTFKGSVMPNSRIEPILDEPTYEEVLRIFNGRRGGTSGTKGRIGTLLSGIAICGVCKVAHVHASAALGKGSYRCATAAHNRHWRAETDAYVEGALMAYLTTSDQRTTQAGSGELETVRAEIVTKTKRLKEWEDSREEFSVSEFVRYTKPLKAEIAALENKVTDLRSEDIFREFYSPTGQPKLSNLSEARKVWDSLPLLRKREILDSTVEVVLLQRTNRDRGFVPERVQVVRK
jgi:site-specific DNA recombinase